MTVRDARMTNLVEQSDTKAKYRAEYQCRSQHCRGGGADTCELARALLSDVEREQFGALSGQPGRYTSGRGTRRVSISHPRQCVRQRPRRDRGWEDRSWRCERAELRRDGGAPSNRERFDVAPQFVRARREGDEHRIDSTNGAVAIAFSLDLHE